MSKFIYNTKEIADFFNVSDRAIRKWHEDKGCPKDGHGRWDLKAVVEWWLDNIYRAGDDDEATQSAKVDYWRAKARVETVKADIAEKSVVKIDQFMDAWVWRVAEVSSGLGSLPMRVAPLVAGRAEHEARTILESEMWKARDKFARTGKFTPTQKKKIPKKRKPAKKAKKKK